MTDDQPIVGGRYQLGEVLGRGGMAEVRRGVDVRLGRPVAIKRLSPELAADPTFQTRFQREAHAVASLNHPTIAAVFDSGEEVDPTTGVSIPYIVMELVQGSTLRDVLREGRPILPERALELTRGVLEALSHSHAAGIVHRDIKPANVMLTPDGAIKVMDFGIARAAADTSTSLTQTASVIGTAQYLSPEQARGESVDLRSDIYSTGCLLYELLTGKPPFSGDSSISVAYQHVREDPRPPSQLDPELSPDIDAVTLKALAKDPADRYQTAAEMSADLGRILAGQPILASAGLAAGATTVAAAAPTILAAAPVPVVGPPTAVALTDPPPPRRSAGRTVLIAALVLALLAALGYGAYRLLGSRGDDLVRVPSVIGAPRDTADRQLRDAKLAPAVINVRGPKDETLNAVVTQEPAAGTEVAPGSTITVEVNVGPADTKVPDDLVGEDVDDAKDALEDAGFTSVRTTKAANPPSDADEGEVVSVDPDEGSPVARGEDITLTYVGSVTDNKTPTARATATQTAERTKSAEAPNSESSEPSDEPTDDEDGDGDGDGDDDDPTESSEPTTSSEPSDTSEPEESDEPTQSSKSVKPTKPTKSAKAATKAAKPDKSARALEPAKDASSSGDE